jgi:hypothetical protein
VSILYDVRDGVPPRLATKVITVTFVCAMVVITYWADRRYRRWAQETSLLAAPRARAAAFNTSYRRKRSDVADATEVVGEIMEAVEKARSAEPAE